MNILGRVLRKIKRIVFEPKIKIKWVPNLINLGSSYGGWTFLDSEHLQNCTIVSAGLGEDASFDILFAGRYGAKVLIVDPTPRAIDHFHQVQARFGQRSLVSYVLHGKQPLEAYELSTITNDNLVLIEKAMWINDDPVRLYKPANPAHVSLSITNFYGNYSQDAPYMEAPSITVKEIMRLYGLTTVPILKIDIEGVETEVLHGMVADGIIPDQILVEFDEIHYPSWRVKRKFERCDAMLRSNGYVCVNQHDVNFTYVQERLCAMPSSLKTAGGKA